MSDSRTAGVQVGEFAQDGRDQAKIIGTDRDTVLIEYLTDGKQIRLQHNRFIRRDGELHIE